jgi:hypothetical protein
MYRERGRERGFSTKLKDKVFALSVKKDYEAKKQLEYLGLNIGENKGNYTYLNEAFSTFKYQYKKIPDRKGTVRDRRTRTRGECYLILYISPNPM